jgi:hypothetical protein
MRIRLVSGLLLVLTTSVTTACGAALVVDGFKVSQAGWNDTQEKVAARFEFETKCPRTQLQLKLLQVGEEGLYGGGGWPAQVGVTGCGQSIVYVNSIGGWIANSKS